jgi:hypothetical protein
VTFYKIPFYIFDIPFDPLNMAYITWRCRFQVAYGPRYKYANINCLVVVYMELGNLRLNCFL